MLQHFFSSCAVVLLCCIPLFSQAQAKLIKKVTKAGAETVIPYEQYLLPNGLTLLVHEDHSDPIVHVDVTYHVGSAREEIGKSGFAHFFEHMMFQGSDNVADEQHFKIITEAGGTLNGSTNRDRTNYYETVPANELEKMLWLEADRMGFFLDAVTQEKFEVQRATVKNERGQRYDNVPYGLVSEVSAKHLYPYGHPYSWLTIGYVEDLNRVTVDDLKNFFLRWYGPNNAVLTVGGAVHTAEVVKLVERYFGSIPRGPEVVPVSYPAPVLTTDRYITLKDNYAKLPMLRMTFPTIPQYHTDELALECLGSILGRGKTSVLYQDFVKTEKAVNASAYSYTSELSGEFIINVTPFPGQQLKDIEASIRQSIRQFEQRGVTDEDMEKFHAAAEARIIRSMESVSGKVSRLAAYFTFTGDAGYLTEELRRYAAVTKEDVLRVYRQYILHKPAVLVSVVTKKDSNNIAAKDNYTVSDTGYKVPDYGYNNLKYVKGKDTFDRSIMPGSGASPAVTTPIFWTKTLAGTIQTIGTHSDEISMVALQLKLKGGQLTDAMNPEKAGLAAFFADMMDEDTKLRSAEDFAMALDKLGSRLSVYATRDGIVIQVQSLRKNLRKTLELLEERLLQPEFKEEVFARNKKRTLENIRNAKARASYVAGVVFPRLLYGQDNVLGWPSSGTEKTITNITLEDIHNYYQQNISRRDALLTIVGDVQQEEIIPLLAFLGKLPDKEISLPELKKPLPQEKTKVFFVDIPGAAQTEFRIGYVTGLKYDALDTYYKAGVMNYPLGGAFNSRLNLHLRESKGWTYGARSYFNGDKYTGTYAFSAGIKAAATDSALTDILQIIRDYRQQGITAAELSFTRNALEQSDARKYESQYQKAAFLNNLLEYDLPAAYPQAQHVILQQITAKEINKLALQLIPDVDKMLILLAGDKAVAGKALQHAGYELVELDMEGNEVKQ